MWGGSNGSLELCPSVRSAKSDAWAVLLEDCGVVLGAGVDLVRLDGGAVALLVEAAVVDLISEFADGHPLVVVLVEDDSEGLVECHPAGRDGRLNDGCFAKRGSRPGDQVLEFVLALVDLREFGLCVGESSLDRRAAGFESLV